MFLGGYRDGRKIGEVSVLGLEDLKWKSLNISSTTDDQAVKPYRFASYSNDYSISKGGEEVTAVVLNSNRYFDLISYSRQGAGRIKVLANNITGRKAVKKCWL